MNGPERRPEIWDVHQAELTRGPVEPRVVKRGQGRSVIVHVRNGGVPGVVAAGERDHFLRVVDAHDIAGAGADEGSGR